MKTNMKSIYKNNSIRIFSVGLVLAVMVALGGMMQSCSSEDDVFADDFISLTKEEKDLVSQFDIVGIIHNEVMDQVYEKLLESLENTNISSNEILAMTLNNTRVATHLSIASTNKFFPKLKNGSSNIDETHIDSFVNMGFKLVVNTKAIKLKNLSNVPITPDETIRDILSNKSQNLNTYLKTLLIITEKNNSIEQYNKEINSLIVNAFKNLGREEMEIFLCASSTAKHSFEYWYTYLHDWENMLLKRNSNNIVRLKNNNSESPYNDPRFIQMRNDIIKWDIGGALGGMVAGSITGPGILLCGIAGSAGSSTTAAIVDAFDFYGVDLWEGFKNEMQQLWNNIFNW